MAYGPDGVSANPVSESTGNTEYSAAAIVIAALVALVLINRGFRGVSVGGASVNIGR